MTQARERLGRFGEELAVDRLQAAGLTVLQRNWRCPDGEVDIVARDGDTVVFCEVKTRRSGDYGAPAEAVTRAKQRRLRRLARRWLVEHPSGYAAVRFDVVSVLRPPAGPTVVEHLPGVF